MKIKSKLDFFFLNSTHVSCVPASHGIHLGINPFKIKSVMPNDGEAEDLHMIEETKHELDWINISLINLFSLFRFRLHS